MTDAARATLRTTRRILGHVVRVRSNLQDVIDLADAAFDAWPRTRARPALRIRLDARTDASVSRTGPRSYRLPAQDRLVIRGPGLSVRVHAGRGRARGTFDAALLHTPDDFRYGVLEATALFMLTHRDRVPFHAAAIVRRGTAVLIAGPSGAGKSTFAHAAIRARSGWSLLSEDCVYLDTGAARVWGWPGFVHLGADAARFFPELRHRTATVLANGKLKLAVATGAANAPRPWTRAAVLCLLERTPAGPRIEEVDRAAAIADLTRDLDPGFDRFADTLPAALDAVVAPTVWRLDPGLDPARALALLDPLIGDAPAR